MNHSKNIVPIAAALGALLVAPTTRSEEPQTLPEENTSEQGLPEENAPAQPLPEVTVLGTREANVPLSNVPASITFVDREEIMQQQLTAPRIEEILSRTTPGFNPTNQGVRQIRGRTAQVFINGVPMNEQLRASSASDLTLLAPDQLEGIEVARGANSAYGFGSPGGIIALTTPRAESEMLTLNTVMRGSFSPHHPGGSYRASVYQSAAQIIGNFDYHVGASYRYDGQTYDPDGSRSLDFSSPLLLGNSKENFYDLDASFGYDLSSAGKLRLAGTFGYADVLEAYDSDFLGTYRRTQSSIVRVPPGDDNFRRAYTLNLSYENPDVFGSAVKFEAFASNVETQVFSSSGTSSGRDEQTNEYYGVRSSVTTPLDFLSTGTAVTYGFDFLRNRYFRPFLNADTGAVITFFSPDVTLDVYAPYAQLEIPVGDFRLSGGARHEEYRGEVKTAVGPGGIQGGDIKPFDLTLFNAGLLYTLTEDIDLFFTFLQGAEISQLGRAARDTDTTDNIKPQPAKSNQYEIGLRGAHRALDYSLSTFYAESNLLSALQRDPANPTGPLVPLREPREFWGVEGTLNWRFNKQWGVGGVLTWYDGIRKTATGDTRRIGSRDVPPLLLTGHLDYSPYSWWRNRLQLDYRADRDPFGDSTAFGEGAVDSVLLVHLAAAFDVGPGELQVGVRNLLNGKYFAIPVQADNAGFYWIPEEGTRLTTSYSVQW